VITTTVIIFTGTNITKHLYPKYANNFPNLPLPITFKDLAVSAAQTCDAPTSVYVALVGTESAWNHLAISKAGAVGLAQLMRATAIEMHVYNRFSPNDNLIGGACYLSFLINKYNGNVRKALHAYNTGPGNVSRGKISKATRKYAERILIEAEE